MLSEMYTFIDEALDEAEIMMVELLRDCLEVADEVLEL